MELMRTHGQLSVFIGVMIEQIIVPIPSPMIIMGAGAILILPGLSIPDAFLQILWVIVLPGSVASTLGSYIGYVISYYGGKALVVRFQRFLGVDWGQIERSGEAISGEERGLEYLSFACHSRLPDLFGFHLCRFASCTNQALHNLYFFGFDLPVFFPWFFWMVDRSDL